MFYLSRSFNVIYNNTKQQCQFIDLHKTILSDTELIQKISNEFVEKIKSFYELCIYCILEDVDLMLPHSAWLYTSSLNKCC